MEPTRDNRPKKAAGSQTAITGENGTKEPAEGAKPQSGASRSWRQYIEQSMPAQDNGAKAEQEETHIKRANPDVKEAAKAGWNRCARWARERWRRARTDAEDARDRMKSGAGAAWKKLGGGAVVVWETLGRGAGRVRDAVARHPVSPLLYATLIAVGIGVMAFQDNYARAYVLEVNDQELGLVSGEDEVNAILNSVETRAASLLGGDFDYDVNVTLSPVYAAPDALSDAAELENTLFEDMQAQAASAYAEAHMTAWALSVDGVEMGFAADKGEFYRMLDEIAQPYIPADAISYEFVEDVQIYPVELPSDTEFDDIELIREELSALRVEEAVYVVKKGDTFNAIAYSLGMWPNELSALNPDVIVNKLWVDQKLVIQKAVPRLSVVAITDETYEDAIPSPVEYIETASLYVGNTKVKEQGEDGLALVNAHVTYLNGEEQDREILQSTTLKEPTTTYTYTGTTPRPTTASNGYFIWPVRGTITSKFGYRYIFGSTSYHGGIDIACSYGTTIKAADGGKVTFAGYQGTYGYLVVITHDDGKQTYYGHNSSLLVKAGQRVYQGQAIAKAGSTGRATGPHCHFEVRVNGTRVNPRNYL